jgi:hypothetical protein
MAHKPEKASVARHIVELRREAVAALKRYNAIADRMNFYEQYLALSKTYSVRLAGPFLVIEGGRPSDRTGTNEDLAPRGLRCCQLMSIQSPTLREVR